MMAVLLPLKPDQRPDAAYKKAAALCDEDAAIHEAIGTHGLKLFEEIYAKKQNKPSTNLCTSRLHRETIISSGRQLLGEFRPHCKNFNCKTMT
jgi:hypothetical protein